MTSLRDYLLDAYGGYADRTIKDRSLDRPIQVDDQGPHDVYPFFCTIFASVPDPLENTLILALQHCPVSPEVLETVEKLRGSVQPTGGGATVILNLKSSQGPAVRRLASSILSIAGPGQGYDDCNRRRICPHAAAAAALEGLAEQLDLYQWERFPEEDAPRPYNPTLARRRRVHIPTSSCNLNPAPRGRQAGGTASR